MRKFLAFIAIGLMGLSATASVNPWTVVSDFTESASNNEEFMVLYADYSNYFGNIDTTQVSSGSIRIVNLQFDGPTTCAINDPRLRAEVAHVTLCYGSYDGPDQTCMASMPAMPLPFDPCL